MKDYIFVGIDLGTTGTKIILMDVKGNLIDKNYIGYQILNPKSGYAEQEVGDWWNGLCKICNSIINRNRDLINQIVGIGISGQMHTQVYLDKNNRILRKAITWMDQRSQPIVDRINSDNINRKLIYENTANFLTTTYTAPHISWVKENEPEVYNKTSKVLLAKDYIKYRLTGEMVTDYSDAVGTLLFNVKEKKWSEEMINLFDLKKSFMPEVDKSAVVIGKITAPASNETGLPEGIPVINGSADQAATSLGAGMIYSGQVTAIVGTAGVISVLSDQPVPDPEHRTLCWNYCLEDKWINLGIMQTAGESLNWFKRSFDSDLDNSIFELYDQEISRIADGSEGLIFLHYLMGERSPHWDGDARGVFFGISLSHGKFHFVRSIMEGVSFAFKNNLEVIESLGIDIKELMLLGGGSKSKEWNKIMGKIINRKINTVDIKETGALGSSILCGLALDIYDSPESVLRDMKTTCNQVYNSEISPVYEENYQKFKILYQKLRGLF